MANRMFKLVVPQGRNERRGEAYGPVYVEPLSDARTQRAASFNILDAGPSPHPMMVQISPHQTYLSPFF